MNLGLAEMQFPAVSRGLLALLSLFLVDLLSRSQFLPNQPLPHHFYANLDKLRDPYFQKVELRTPRLIRVSPMEENAVLVLIGTLYVGKRYLPAGLFVPTCAQITSSVGNQLYPSDVGPFF